MEKLHEIAKAHFVAASEDTKRKAADFFKEMDKDSNGKVSLHEFLEIMKKKGHKGLRNKDLFKKLCRRDSKNLEFMDAITLCYIILSGRSFCDGCDEFIDGTSFCCTECFYKSEDKYCLCIDCFNDKKYHKVHPHTKFLDEVSLLEQQRRKHASKGAAIFPDQKNDGATNNHALVPAETAMLPPKQENDGATNNHAPVPAETATPLPKQVLLLFL
ncbi:hypothetical protein PTKIN_Ptkin10aG0031200 [Pterospermum kingtungense]